MLNRKFFPFFLTQALGAFNDNVFKSALVILIAYQTADKAQADILVQLCAGLFILPFFLFSGVSGQVCDKYPKKSLISLVKMAEVFIMAAGAYCFYSGNINASIFILFLMGSQSTVFGPIKYSIIKELTSENDLVKANALVSSSTFAAILLGTIVGGLLVKTEFLNTYHFTPINSVIIGTAILGTVTALFMIRLPGNIPNLKINKNIIDQSFRLLKETKQYPEIYRSLHAISWFWFIGFYFMASLPSYCRDILGGDEVVATLLLTMITIGISIGAFICGKISQGKIDQGLVGIGSIGITISALLIFFVKTPFLNRPDQLYIGIESFFLDSKNLLVCLGLIMLGVFGGLYTVPLYSFIQKKAPIHLKAQVIASNNIINSFYMVSAAVFAIILLKLGFNIRDHFLIVGILNIIVFIKTVKTVPVPFFQLAAKLVLKILYRIEVEGVDNIPRKGGAIIASNHVSFIDPPLVGAFIKRQCFFLMDKGYYDMKLMNWWFKLVDATPILPAKIDRKQMNYAIDEICQKLEAGKIVVLFPEGFITRTGELIEFKSGIEVIAKRAQVPVIPTALKGLWGSWASRKKGAAFRGWPTPTFRRIKVIYGNPIPPEQICRHALQSHVQQLIDKE